MNEFLNTPIKEDVKEVGVINPTFDDAIALETISHDIDNIFIEFEDFTKLENIQGEAAIESLSNILGTTPAVVNDFISLELANTAKVMLDAALKAINKILEMLANLIKKVASVFKPKLKVYDIPLLVSTVEGISSVKDVEDIVAENKPSSAEQDIIKDAALDTYDTLKRYGSYITAMKEHNSYNIFPSPSEVTEDGGLLPIRFTTQSIILVDKENKFALKHVPLDTYKPVKGTNISRLTDAVDEFSEDDYLDKINSLRDELNDDSGNGEIKLNMNKVKALRTVIQNYVGAVQFMYRLSLTLLKPTDK